MGTWLSLGSITASRFLARSGFHWLTVDIEHSLVDWETATHMFASIADAGCTALARVPANRHDHIKRVLDNGAHGVVVPMVNSRAEAEAAVAACLYPPVGNRSVGGNVHALNFDTNGPDYFEHANEEILVVLQCEHIQCVENAEAIFAVPGIDAMFVGPNDLAASMRGKDGKPPQRRGDAEGPGPRAGHLQTAQGRRPASIASAPRKRTCASQRAGNSWPSAANCACC